jgi:hypothetical protein
MTIKGGYLQVKPDWFKPENYTGFDRVSGEPYQNLQDLWSKSLQLRRILLNPASHLPENLKDECIEKLIQNPLDDCGFGKMNYISHKELLWDQHSPSDKTHPYGQPTVSPTRYGQISESITNTTNIAPGTCLDDLYFQDSLNSHPSAFLTINLAASDSLIKRDFNNWLTAIRSYRNWQRTFNATPEALIAKWAGYKLIQCIDLIKIIGPAKGVKISIVKAAAWAQVHPGRIQSESFTTRTLPRAMDLALSPQASDYLA